MPCYLILKVIQDRRIIIIIIIIIIVYFTHLPKHWDQGFESLSVHGCTSSVLFAILPYVSRITINYLGLSPSKYLNSSQFQVYL